jgi:hypothetical protein
MLIILIVQGYPEIALQVSLVTFGCVIGIRKLMGDLVCDGPLDEIFACDRMWQP